MDHSRKFLQWQAFKTLLKTEELGNMIEAKAKQVQLFINEYSEKTRNSRPSESALLIGINENFSLTNFLLQYVQITTFPPMAFLLHPLYQQTQPILFALTKG